MANNAVLEYLDLICSTKYSTKHNFFSNKKSFAPIIPTSNPASAVPRTPPSRHNSSRSDSIVDFISTSPVSSSPEGIGIQELPIHLILKDIYAAAASNNAKYFEPLILHYWQLQRLLEILRCNTKILSLSANQYTNKTDITKLHKEISATHPDMRHILRAKEKEIEALERSNIDIQNELDGEILALRNGQRPQDKENIQAVLVLSTLLNVVFRQGMSVPLISDQFRLEAQQHECKNLLKENCGIEFDESELAYAELFGVHHTVQTEKTVPERIQSEFRDDWAWFMGTEQTDPMGRALATARYYVSRVLGTQAGHALWNHPRLGGTRSRRLMAFLEPYLKSEAYTAFFKTIDPFMRFVLSYVNWLFFIPRLSLHLSLLGHHLFNYTQLADLERNVPFLTRFRAHWTRFGFEFIIDSYWFLNGLKLCFWLPGGALSPQGIILSLIIQCLDLFCSVARAVVELRRLSNMASDLNAIEPNLALKSDNDKRFRFEAFALGYMVFHFSVLLMSLCLTLPSMAAISLALPVVGGTCAVLMTILTFYMQDYWIQQRARKFECKPKPLNIEENLKHLPSSRYSHVFA